MKNYILQAIVFLNIIFLQSVILTGRPNSRSSLWKTIIVSALEGAIHIR